MKEEVFRELSSGHALGALSDEEEREFAAALAAHPEWRDIVEEDIAAASALALTTPAMSPPPALREKILDAVATEKTAPAPKPRRRLRASLFALAASIVLILAIAVVPRLFDTSRDVPPVVVAMEAIEAADDGHSATAEVPGGGSVTLHWSVSAGSAVVESTGLPALTADEAYELWYVRGDTPVSAGLLEGSDQSLTLLDGEPHAGDVVAITVEEAGGSDSGAPTSDPIVAVETG